jgi:hypothetical protein
MMHHAAGADSLREVVKGRKKDRSYLQGLLAHFLIDKSGTLHLVNDGVANHATPGAEKVLVEMDQGIVPSGTAAACGLADSMLGGRFLYGFENENLGDGMDPWPEAQLDAMARAAAVCHRHGWNADRVIAHKEWTQRRQDRDFDMNEFRARIARLL